VRSLVFGNQLSWSFLAFFCVALVFSEIETILRYGLSSSYNFLVPTPGRRLKLFFSLVECNWSFLLAFYIIA